MSRPIRDMFETLVPEYDRFNRVSSLGMDTSWRNELAANLHGTSHVLDVGTGTGDVASELASRGKRVVGIDFANKMVEAAQRKLGKHPRVSFQVAEAQNLPFADDTFDGLTSAFVIRNLHHGGHLNQAFHEFNRVLQEGGKMVHLELTRPPQGLMSWGHDLYIKSILPVVGRVFFGKRWPQGYLQATIEKFPSAKELCQRIRWAGFQQVSHYPLSGGIASLFCGVKC